MGSVSVSSESYEGRYFKFTVSQSGTGTTVNWTFEVLGGSATWYSTSPIDLYINGYCVKHYDATSYTSQAFPAAKGSVSSSYNIGSYGSFTVKLSGRPYYSSATSSTGTITLDKPSYTVTFVNGLGTTLKTQTVLYGNDATPPSNPTRNGYTFTGWSGTYTNVTSNRTITATWTENLLTINYYSNYADYGTFKGESLDVSASKNVLVYSHEYYYDNSYSDGLYNIQNTDVLYLSKIGYTPTGYWGTSTSGGTLVDQSTSFSTGQALAEALGKDITNGNASINIYAQWRANVLTIKYHVNGGTVNSDKYYISNNLIYLNSSSSVLEDKWNYNNAHTNGLYNASTFGLTREGYDFVGWKIGSSGTTIFDQDDTSIVPTDLADNIKTGDRTITLYAEWKLSGVVYIDNGTEFERYLVYIDNGTSWDLYVAYIDDGTSWNIIS